MDFKFTRIQKDWVTLLLKHPEWQGFDQLGLASEEDGRRLCCLGLLSLLTNSAPLKWGLEDGDRVLELGNGRTHTLVPSAVEEAGLRDSIGAFINNRRSLAEMNDQRISWREIAWTIVSQPNQVFKKAADFQPFSYSEVQKEVLLEALVSDNPVEVRNAWRVLEKPHLHLTKFVIV